MQDHRPVNLNITTMKFPVTAIVSIGHRLSGLMLFVFIPFILWLLGYSLSSPANFGHMQQFMDHFILRFFAWVFISALVYHLIAGVRHLLMDIHIGESKSGGHLGAWLVALFSAVLIIGMGIYLLVGFNHSIW